MTYYVSYDHGHPYYGKTYTVADMVKLGIMPEEVEDAPVYYVDDHTPVDYNNRRPCALCGRKIPENGIDPCLTKMVGVRASCCGHGVEDPYLMTDSGLQLKCSGLHTHERDFYSFAKVIPKFFRKGGSVLVENGLICFGNTVTKTDKIMQAQISKYYDLYAPIAPVGKYAYDVWNGQSHAAAYQDSSICGTLAMTRDLLVEHLNCPGISGDDIIITLPSRQLAYILWLQISKQDTDVKRTNEPFWTFEMKGILPYVVYPDRFFYAYVPFDDENIYLRPIIGVSPSAQAAWSIAYPDRRITSAISEFVKNWTSDHDKK